MGQLNHPFEPHDADLVAVEVVWPAGVREDGKVYKRGQTLTIMRGHALAQNQPGRQVYRVLATVRYANDPNPNGSAEQPVEEGPLPIS